MGKDNCCWSGFGSACNRITEAGSGPASKSKAVSGSKSESKSGSEEAQNGAVDGQNGRRFEWWWLISIEVKDRTRIRIKMKCRIRIWTRIKVKCRTRNPHHHDANPQTLNSIIHNSGKRIDQLQIRIRVGILKSAWAILWHGSTATSPPLVTFSTTRSVQHKTVSLS